MRKCSHCGVNGHNSRTCNGNGCVKLFGVNIKRSLSTGDLEGYEAKSRTRHVEQEGYHSDEDHCGRGRKKGKPWSEEEHRSFLAGLLRQGKGDWRGISRNFVPTRTPTQVASHAQKYYMRRQASNERKKRRSSVFDMTLPEFVNTSTSVASKDTIEPQNQNNLTAQVANQFPCLTLEKTQNNSTMAPTMLPYYMANPYTARVSNWNANYMRPCKPFVPYNNGGTRKLSPYAAVHPRPIFPKPPGIPLSAASTSKGVDSLELELKVGQALPQSPRATNLVHKASGPVGVTS